ncbi:MAG TPA: gamma carbonic anhydrase family protein [bacterium]|nr:gamma carbonic anhydrase family protein [bacterium]
MIAGYLNTFPRIDEKAFVFKGATVIGDVVIGPESNIWFGVVLRGDVNYIRIGARTNIQDNATVHVTTALYPTEIGDEVTVGHNAVIHGSTIGDRTLIGMGAVLLDGCRIGKNVIVAAGSIVRMKSVIPDGVLVAGNPAVIKRDITEDERLFFERSAANYVKYSYNYLTSSSDILYSREELNAELT